MHDQGAPLTPDDDGDLVTRVARGDMGAMETLARRHQAAVFRYVRGLVATDAAAEDAMQEAFLDALRGAHTFRGDARVRTWLLTLARHAAYRHRRPRAGEPRQFESLAVLGERAGWGADDPERVTQRFESAQALARALDQLDSDDREVIVVRELEGLTGPESADLLGISVGALKSRLHRARLRLAAALREELPDGP